MKRLCVLLIALAMVAIMVAPAAATWTRVMTMGNQGMYIQDDYNVWQWTSTVNNYPRHLVIDHSIDADSYNFGDVDYDGGTRVGMIVPFLKNQVLGVFISDFDVEWSFNIAPDADQKIDLFWGYRGATFDLGARIDHYSAGTEFGGKNNQSKTGINVGAGFNLSGNMLEANLMYNSLSWKYETTGAAPNDPVTEKESGTDMAFAARYLIAYSSMVTLVPAFSYRSQKVAEKVGPATAGIGDGTEFKSTGYDLGVGCNTVPLQGTEFLTSIGVRSIKFEDTDTSGVLLDQTNGQMPYISFGAEIQVKNWLAMRFGAEKTWDNFKDQTPTVPVSPESKSSGADFDYHVGASIMVGDLQFDVDVNPSWFNAGPYLLSGSSAGQMFSYISIKYDYR